MAKALDFLFACFHLAKCLHLFFCGRNLCKRGLLLCSLRKVVGYYDKRPNKNNMFLLWETENAIMSSNVWGMNSYSLKDVACM